MIAQLNGIIISKNTTELIIDCNGVGYLIYISLNTSSILPDIGNKASIFTLLIPREDSIQLYGFANEAEREAFKMLISISGIGPKSAIAILSSMSVEILASYIATSNVAALQKLPGIGKKTAERLILELKDKILKLNLPVQDGLPPSYNLIYQEALSALITLGYSTPIAEKAIKKVLSQEPSITHTAEELIRKALRIALQ